MAGHSHTVKVDPATGDIMLASEWGKALDKIDIAVGKVEAMRKPTPKKSPARTALSGIRGAIVNLRSIVENRKRADEAAAAAGQINGDPGNVELMRAKAQTIMGLLAAYGRDFKVKDIDIDLPELPTTDEEYGKLAEEVSNERLGELVIHWQAQVAESEYKEGDKKIWPADWSLTDAPAVRPPAIAVLKAAAIAAKADGLLKIRPLMVSDENPSKRAFHKAAGDVAADQAKQFGKGAATAQATKDEIEAKTGYTPGALYGRIDLPTPKQTADRGLTEAVGTAGGIVRFLQAMATTGTAGGISLAQLAGFWSAKQDNVDYLKNAFRAATAGHHEWIPSNMILEVCQIAQSPVQLAKAVGWSRLQHELRADTSHLIFKPSYATGTKMVGGREVRVLCGHAGALYVQTDKKIEPSTASEGRFHERLRSAVDKTSIATTIVKLREVMADTIWNPSTEPMPAGLHTEYLTSDGKKVDFANIAAIQEGHWNTVNDVFTTVATALASYG